MDNETFDDLVARIRQAAKELEKMADEPNRAFETATRLRAKATGVRLALTYIDETVRVAAG